MREYRGIDIITGEWIFGSLIVDEKGNHYIGRAIMPAPSKSMLFLQGRRNSETLNRFIGMGFSMVIPVTVGEDTGMTDMNGKQIFEGDIVHTKEFNLKDTKYEDHNYLIEFANGYYFLSRKKRKMALNVWNHQCEVIGNKFENSNLLK